MNFKGCDVSLLWYKIFFVGIILLPLIWAVGFYFYQVKIGIPRDVNKTVKEIIENRNKKR